MSRSQLDVACRQIEFARNYTLQLLADIDESDWFRQPTGCCTHIAWQVGHLAMAEYALTMVRIRGKEPTDESVLPADFFRRFKKGTEPAPDPHVYPTPSTIRQVLDRVHRQALTELATYTDADLDVKLPEPHMAFDTKLGSVYFCSAHEMLHAGQIGLLRRMLGKAPLR